MLRVVCGRARQRGGSREEGLSTRTCCFFFSSRRRHTRLQGDWSSDVCSSDLISGSDALQRYNHGFAKSEESVRYLENINKHFDQRAKNIIGVTDTGGARPLSALDRKSVV